MKFNFFTQKLASYRVWLASALLLLTFMSGIEAQSISQIVTHVDATTCTSPTGSITINPTGTNLLGDASGYFYLLRIEREGVQALQTNSLNQTQVNAAGAGGGFVLANQVPGTYTVTTQIWDGNTNGVVYDVKVTTVVIRALNDNVAPVFTNCPATINVTSAICTGIITYPTPTATDDCGTVNVTRTSGPASGTSVAAGSYTVVHTATDLAGNTSTCTSTLVVTATPDAIAPTLGNNVGVGNNGLVTILGASWPTGTSLNATAACGVTPNFSYVVPYFADNCSATIVNNSSPALGTPSIVPGTTVSAAVAAGTYVVAFRVTDAAGNSTTYSTTINVIAPSLVCVGQVNISLPSTCSATLTVADVLASGACATGAVVEIKRNGVWGSANLTSADVNKSYEYRVTRGGNTCWGNVKVEDKTGPLVVCPADIALNCDNANAATLPPSATGNPTVTDCSAYTTSYSDVVTATGCGGTKTVVRTWTAKDAFGNVGNTCTQTITVTRTVVAPTVANVTLTCEAGYPSITSNTPSPAGVCGLSFEWEKDTRVNLCGNTYKIIRVWKVIDQCGAGTMVSFLEQLITVQDAVKPTLTVKGTSYDLVNGAAFNICGTSFVPKKLQPSQQTSGTVGGAGAATGTITINAWADSRTCGMGTFSLDVTGADNCGTATITSSDSRFPVVAGKISGTIMAATTSFVVTSTDQCGNTSSVTVTVNYIDNISPTAVCDGVTATLNNYKQAIITGASFNNSSTDNCAIDRIVVAKANADGSAGAFCTDVTYGCSDVGVAGLKVWIRYIDLSGNYTDCCVPLEIKDKAGIYCVNGGDVSVPCNDPSLSTYESLFKEPSVFYDGCSTVTPTVTNSSEALNCGAGSFTRSWKYTITNSLGTVVSNVCTSKITVTPVLGFRLKPLTNQNLTCAGAVTTKEQDQASIIASLKLLHTGAYTAAVNTPPFAVQPATGASVFRTCSAPAVDITESVYTNTEFCKVIVRTYVVKDLCQLSTATSSQTAIDEYVPVSDGDYQSFVKDGGHYIRYTRTITIKDKTAPTSNQITVADICDYSTSCNFSFSQPLNGSDLCDGAASGSNLFYSWSIVNAAGVEIARNTTNTVSATGLAYGTYTVYYYVSDVCGNTSIRYSFTVKGGDCKKPAIVCKNVNAELMPTGVAGVGAIIVPIDDLFSWASDNCTPFEQLKWSLATVDGGTITAVKWVNGFLTEVAVGTGIPAIKYSCADATATNNVRKVQVWIEDLSGNKDYCEATVTLQNHMGACGSTSWLVSGGARTESNAVVNNVTVSASANGTAISSSDVLNGSYSLTVPAASTNVQVRAAKNNNDDAASGVTTFDIAKVSQHVLDIEKLATPYKLIAADVDKSGEIDATDMLHMRRFILKITPSLPGGNFRFVDKAYSFRNAANPFGEDFPEVVTIASLASNVAANFVAVKLGDVNDSYAALAPRSSRTLSFLADDMNVVAGNEYTVNISADKMDAAAFQGTFSFAGATVKSVKAGNLANMTDGNFGVFANAVTTSWNGKTQASADVLAITFVATKSGKLSEMLTINSELTQAVANDATGAEMNVNLKFNTGKVAGGEFALYQNQPNPVANETTIGFNLPKDGTARLTVTAVDGKVVKVINGNYKAGYNTISVNKSDLNATGVFYYRLETADHSASKKMVIIE